MTAERASVLGPLPCIELWSLTHSHPYHVPVFPEVAAGAGPVFNNTSPT